MKSMLAYEKMISQVPMWLVNGTEAVLIPNNKKNFCMTHLTKSDYPANQALFFKPNLYPYNEKVTYEYRKLSLKN